MSGGLVYCILGGGGAFGLHTASYLLERGAAAVHGIGRSPLRVGAFSLGLERCESFTYRQFHVGHELDLLLEYLDRIKPDVIVNFAAQGEGAASWRHSWRFFDTNATALCRLYEELSVREWFNPRGRFVHIGTSELYGSVDRATREDDPIVPSSPYAASKAAFDLYLLAMARAGRGAPMNIIRPSNCYCEGQLLHRIIPRAIVAGLTGRKLPLHGGGRAKKSYMHARDLASAIYLVSEVAPAGEVYNAGPAFPISILNVAVMCAKTVEVEFDDLFEVAEERLGQDSQYWLDSSKLRALGIGWQPEVGWQEGLDRVRVWAEANLDELRDTSVDYQLRA